MTIGRREILRSALLSAGLALSRSGFATDKSEPKLGPLCVFAKPLQWLSFDELATLLVDQQWDGIEATVRRGGQVEPNVVQAQLPRLVESLDAKNKQVVLFASDILSPEQQDAETTLRTAAGLGIKYYRMAYYHYDVDQPILPQLDQFAKQLESLVALNRELGMTALYQNHAGTRYVGAGLWDLYQLVQSQPKEQVAVAFDIRHATVEAGTTWPIHWSLLKPHVGALYFKDFHLQGRKVENVPLGTGFVDQAFYKMIREQPINGIPVSMHMEYIDHRKPELIGQSIEAVANDRAAIKRLLNI